MTTFLQIENIFEVMTVPNSGCYVSGDAPEGFLGFFCPERKVAITTFFPMPQWFRTLRT